MKHHDCYTNQQGRLPCTCDRSPLGSPWDWIDDIEYCLDRTLLIVCAAFIVAIAYRIFY